MASTTQIKKFIAEIAPCAQKAYKTLGKVKPSVCIGMACVESGYGTAGSCKHHSYLGQKVGTGKTATKYWSGNFFTSKTSEEYTVGTHTIITAAFRAYDSMQQCVLNYYELLNTSLYARVLASSDYATQMQQIKTCGYMTSSTEVNSVLQIIKTYDLTQYDDVSGTSTSASTTTSTTVPSYTVGNNYTTTVSLRVRKGPGNNWAALTHSELTANAQKCDKDKNGCLDVGTTVTCKEIKTIGANIWIRIPSGWIAAYYNGKIYVK